MKTKFTPGPLEYKADEGAIEEWGSGFRGNTCQMIDNPYDGYLYAAAPEMYEMLERAKSELLSYNSHNAILVNQIESLLKKARGE